MMAPDDNNDVFRVNPIGFIRRNKNKVSLDILEKYKPALKQLENFSHVIVFWWAHGHANDKDRNKLQTNPLYAKNKLTGVFACRAEYRPNPINLTPCKILGVDEKTGKITIGDIDAFDGTAILDLKAYIPVADRVEDVKVPNWISKWPDWMPENGLGLKVFGDKKFIDPKKNVQNTKDIEYEIQPIGYIRKKNGKTYLEINKSYTPGLKQLEHFSHVQILWWFSRFDKDRYRRIKRVNPPYGDAPTTGIFATRSPVRPNPIALTTVKFAKIDYERGTIELPTFDAFEDTPIIDLKPYIPFCDRVKDVKVPGWLEHWPDWAFEGDIEVVCPENLRPSDSQLLERHQINMGRTEKPSKDLKSKSDKDNKEPSTYLGILPDPGEIVIKGAQKHNLRNIDLTIPRNKFTVITGVSGSGKSSLAFDTLYATGQRRYMESLSTVARRLLDQMEKPEVEQVQGLNPTIAIEQRSITRNPRSTVGTITEIMDYLRILFARIGTRHCPQCGRAITPRSKRQIIEQLRNLNLGTEFKLMAPLVRDSKGTHTEILNKMKKSGFKEVQIDGDTLKLDNKNVPKLGKDEQHNIDLIINKFNILDKLGTENKKFREVLHSSVETSLEYGKGTIKVALPSDEEFLITKHVSCPYCNLIFFKMSPSLFSFNSPEGMCSECNGLGVKLEVDPDLVVSKPEISVLDGASTWYGNLRKVKPSGNWMRSELFALADHMKVNLDQPWKNLPDEFKQAALYGTGDEIISWTYDMKKRGRSISFERPVAGAVNNIKRLFQQTNSEEVRKRFAEYMSEQPCSECRGERLCPEARFVTIGEHRLPEISIMTIARAHLWLTNLPKKLEHDKLEIANEIIRELTIRLQSLLNVGLHYLSLDRPAPTISGGEGQRLRLATQLGGGLVGLIYILDEPSIGLHPRDHNALLDTLMQLRDSGNTVIVVEHDAETMRKADWLIDLGPGAGVLGGELIVAGKPDKVIANQRSITGQYLSGKLKINAPNRKQRRKSKQWLSINGAKLHNLKNIDVSIPLGVLTCVTGVSGSGKSSLVSQTLSPALMKMIHGNDDVPGPFESIENTKKIDKVINITQSPIGRTPRSNPGTYVGVFDEIRKLFANTAEAKAKGYKLNRFSFNDKGGRCEVCQGLGKRKVEMHFLPDVWVICQECSGKRFNHKTLEIKYKEKNIADILDMDVQQALDFFSDQKKITHILKTLQDVGLDYIKLGQSALTLSGGEAQRVKLAKELSKKDTGNTLYILDEPTTGLHFADIQKLLDVLHRLTDDGNTIVIIEHNLDIIKTADWIIDLGPEGGDDGGFIVAEGTPEMVAERDNSYTGQFLKEIIKT